MVKPRARQLGVTDDDYAAMLAAQGGRCAIQSPDYACTVRSVTRRYHVDHDHKTGVVRGLTCHVHNRRLWAGATPAELRALADYLERSAVDGDRRVTGGAHRVGAGGSPLVNVEAPDRAPGVEGAAVPVAGDVEPRPEPDHVRIDGDGAPAGAGAGRGGAAQAVRRDEDAEAVRRRAM